MDTPSEKPARRGNRLSKIVTRTGDGGQTGLGDGTRIAKDDPRIQAIGEVDELNSAIGVLLAEDIDDDLRTLMTSVQHDLFDLGGELCLPGQTLIGTDHVARLERAVENLNAELPMLKEFILPGGTRPAALAHLARTVCRRTERAVVVLASSSPVNAPLRQYLNRLSDLLFVLGRTINRRARGSDVLWRRGGAG